MALVYTSADDVRARVPGRTIGTTSKPTTAQVEAWLGEGEGLVLGALSAGGASAPEAGTTGATIIKSWVCDYAEGHTRQAWASTAGDDNKDGQAQLDKFDKLLNDIYDHPARYQSALNSGAANEATTYVRGANTDPEDENYVPVGFERDEVY